MGWIMGYRHRLNADDFISSREELNDLLLRVDSLTRRAELGNAYMGNITRLLETGRVPSDSAAAVQPVAPMPPDSLMDATTAERKFRNGMEQRGAYRVSMLASMAAEGVRFGPVASAGILTKNSMMTDEAEIVIPTSDPVLAPADGRIIDIYYSNLDGGYTVVIQHPRGFISRLSGLGSIIVESGSTIYAGDPIGFGTGKSSYLRGIVRMRLWHNGSALPPARFISNFGQKN